MAWRSIEELVQETEAAVESTADKHNRKLFRRLNDPHGGDKPVEHPMESLHPPTRNFKNISSNFTMPVTSWKPEEHNKMTYTRFWNLIREGAVDKVCGSAAAGDTALCGCIHFCFCLPCAQYKPECT